MWNVSEIWNWLKSPLLERKRERKDIALILLVLAEQECLNGFSIVCQMRAHDPEALPKGHPYVYMLLNVLEQQGKITHRKEVCVEGQPERKVYSLVKSPAGSEIIPKVP